MVTAYLPTCVNCVDVSNEINCTERTRVKILARLRTFLNIGVLLFLFHRRDVVLGENNPYFCIIYEGEVALALTEGPVDMIFRKKQWAKQNKTTRHAHGNGRCCVYSTY